MYLDMKIPGRKVTLTGSSGSTTAFIWLHSVLLALDFLYVCVCDSVRIKVYIQIWMLKIH